MNSIDKRIIYMRHKEKLKYIMNLFLTDCNGKNRKEVMELYARYEKMWVEYSESVNAHNKKMIVFVDEFESCVRVKGYETMLQMKGQMSPKVFNDYIKLLDYLRYKTWYQKIWFNLKHWVKKNGS